MLSLDLRGVLFAFLLVVLAAVALTVWLCRRHRRPVVLSAEDIWAVLERVPIGWLIVDSPTTYCYANPYTRNLLGLESVAGPLPQAWWVDSLREGHQAARRGDPATCYADGAILPQEHFVRWWIVPFDNLDLVVMVDATAYYRLRYSVGSIFDGLSHELRTPIGSFLIHLDVLGAPDIAEEVKQRSIQMLKAEAKRMARLVNQMLQLGRLDLGIDLYRHPEDVVSVAQMAIDSILPQAEERGMTITLQADPALPPIVGDSDRLLQAFLNLLDNAIKYCRPGDRVEVTIRRIEEGIECSVRDNGPGIPAKHLPYLTRRFYRAAPQAMEGSGLGLALVDEVVRYHNGRLEIESHTEGEETGTCVRFILPVLEEEKA